MADTLRDVVDAHARQRAFEHTQRLIIEAAARDCVALGACSVQDIVAYVRPRLDWRTSDQDVLNVVWHMLATGELRLNNALMVTAAEGSE